MYTRSYAIVNSITLYRMIAAPVLLLLILNDQPDVFKWLLALSFFTDAIDGPIARRYNAASKWGARIDSAADDLTIFVATVGMYVFKPDFFRKEIGLIGVVFLLFLLQTILALLRYKKLTAFHTYAAKLAACFQGVFLILLFFLEQPLYILFYITLAITAIQLLEEILIVMFLPHWETDVKGLYWVIRKI